MASPLLPLLFLNVILLSSIFTNGEFASSFAQSEPMKRKAKVTHLHFYFHDTVSGPKPTAIQIAKPANATTNGFGSTLIMDDPLTEGPQPTSKIVGRAQGIYAAAGQVNFGLLMVLNFVFLEGKYNGSTLSVLGRNAIFNPVREMPIVGGSGRFRFARGYALARTLRFSDNGDAVVRYNVTVLHY